MNEIFKRKKQEDDFIDINEEMSTNSLKTFDEYLGTGT
jgi:hypothetical protein